MTKNKQITAILFSSLIIIGSLVWFFSTNLPRESLVQPGETKGCVFKQEERIVRGDSLTGLVEPGETVMALFGYYDCNEVVRDDLVLYSFGGGEEPLVKIVRGIEGDSFELSEGGDGWHIIINREILKNSKGESYLLDQRGFNMLSLYVRDYGAIIPEDTFLVMGNQLTGTIDSTRHGLVHKTDILGKAELINSE